MVGVLCCKISFGLENDIFLDIINKHHLWMLINDIDMLSNVW